jgi:hypothetical protein
MKGRTGPIVRPEEACPVKSTISKYPRFVLDAGEGGSGVFLFHLPPSTHSGHRCSPLIYNLDDRGSDKSLLVTAMVVVVDAEQLTVRPHDCARISEI